MDIDNKIEKADSESEETIRKRHAFYEKIKGYHPITLCDEKEFFERLKKYVCVECAIDPAHDFEHNCDIPHKTLIKWIVEQESIHYEPSSPMYSKESFEGLNLKTMVLDTLFAWRLNKPTKVQGEALPAILADPPKDEKYEPDNPMYMCYSDSQTPYHEFNAFLYGGARVQITTDILSRAEMDFSFEQSVHIVNFDLPINHFCEVDFETYLHRIGRSGRFDNEAIAINLIDSEQSMGVCRAIEEYFGKEIQPLNADDPNDVELKLCPKEVVPIIS